PAIASEATGDFVVVWVSSGSQDGSVNGIFGRRFTSAGTGLATEFQVNSFTPSNQQLPSVGADADGDFVVSWISYTQDGANYGLFARRFSSSGARLAVEFQVSTYTFYFQGTSSIAAAPGGDFVIAWDSIAQDGSGYGVFARRFSSTGTPIAFEFQVNTYTSDHQIATSAAA